ncbi:MAG: ribonuclease H family protein [Lachnospiraceae bacterium]|nr:ribonuclease H family protein [Lachnospiraceae bacterium]
MANKFYAVKIGKTPGIYYNWDDCKANVNGYPGAIYKSFKTIQEANEFMGYQNDISLNAETTKTNKSVTIENDNVLEVDRNILKDESPFAFVDGSFNVTNNVYGYGGFLIANGEKYILMGSGDEPEMASMRNVAGEVLGSQAAIKKALELGLSELTIYYDYAGIEMWALGNWKRNKKGTIAYYDYVNSIRHKISLNFVKVKGHSGIDGNEEADRLAKKAVGIE